LGPGHVELGHLCIQKIIVDSNGSIDKTADVLVIQSAIQGL